MDLEKLQGALPDWAKDLRLNLSSLQRSEVLSEQQLWGAMLASAIATREPALLAAIHAEARKRLSDEALSASRTAAALMGMNNVYYRFVHLVEDPTYATLPARLRMQGLATHGVEALDFELWCLAVSAINGCGRCVASHERSLRKEGASPTMIQEAARVASIVHAAGVVLESERALSAGDAALGAV